MAEKIRQKHRKTATPSAAPAGARTSSLTPVDRLRTMSPAAQKLGRGLVCMLAWVHVFWNM